MSLPPAETRSAFAHFHRIETRWKDNDVFGHVNNVVYYSYFEYVDRESNRPVPMPAALMKAAERLRV